jgi:hydroxyethylthiazole kinase-like uncharacterized protein yjeF
MTEVLGYSADQVRVAERPMLAAGVPLMQRAAAGLAAEVLRLLTERGRSASDARVLLLVGSGDNGGDTLHAGAELAHGGAEVWFVQTGVHLHMAAAEAARHAGVQQTSPANVRDHAAECDVILDGILGIFSGVSPGLHEAPRDVVAAILPVLRGRQRPLVVAVDIPSGVSADDGSAGDSVILPADVTVTFGAMKAGLLLSPGAEIAGEVRLVDIGLGPQLRGVEPLVRLER